MAMSDSSRFILSLIGLAAIGALLYTGHSAYTEYNERAQARANIARAETRAKAAAAEFNTHKAAIVADALALAEKNPPAALKALIKYEAYDDATVAAALATIRDKVRDADVARARELIKQRNFDEAHSLLLAHNKPGASAAIGALFDQISKERQQAVANAARDELAQRKREGVQIGMSAERVLQSNWGKPERVNRTVRANGVREQWVYPGSHSYLYFENGILVTIQN